MISDYETRYIIQTENDVEELRIRLTLSFERLKEQLDEIDRNSRISLRFLREMVIDI